MMNIEIRSPESLIYRGEASKITVPGFEGDFQILKNHAPLISVLKEGYITSVGPMDYEGLDTKDFDYHDSKSFKLKIHSGTLEVSENKVVVLVD